MDDAKSVIACDGSLFALESCFKRPESRHSRLASPYSIEFSLSPASSLPLTVIAQNIYG
jgi:hypothetical protein